MPKEERSRGRCGGCGKKLGEESWSGHIVHRRKSRDGYEYLFLQSEFDSVKCLKVWVAEATKAEGQIKQRRKDEK